MSKQSIIYLDHAAATPLDRQVLAAMQPFFADKFYNPSAMYAAAREVRQALDAARSGIAHWLGARPSEVIFTAGGTEANNLALFGTAIKYKAAEIISTQIEHESILQPLESLQERGCRYKLVRPGEDGIVDPQQIAAAITDKTVLVSVGYANNEIGTIQPIRDISRIIQGVRKHRQAQNNTLPLYFHTDACQAANYLDLHVARLGVDLMTLNGGKIYGPKQSGALYVKAGIELEPLIFGGGQERGLRSGTENVVAAVGFALALELAQKNRHEETAHLRQLQKQFMQGLQSAIPHVIINGSLKHRLPNNIHVTIPGEDNERLLIQLEAAGILAAAGSACSASSEEPSHVLRALGLSDDEARASLRFTLGRSTTITSVQAAIKVLTRLVP